MKTATINGIKKNITFKASTGILLKASHQQLKTAQYGADIYAIEGDDGKIVVATPRTGSEIKQTTTYIDAKSYDEILELDDPYNNIPFHRAIMAEMGFNSI